MDEPKATLRQALTGARLPWSSVAMLMHLSKLRSEAIIGQRLAAQFPTEASWTEFLRDPMTVREVDDFAQLVADIRRGHTRGIPIRPEDVADMAAPHMDRARESLYATADALGLSEHVDDLMLVLVNA